MKIPKDCELLHHEVELGVVIGKPGKFIEQGDAMEHVAGYVLALDMTARDIQRSLHKKSWPWFLSKSFDTSCPISDFIPKSLIKDYNNINIRLMVNGEIKQNGNTKDMIYKIPRIISYISQFIKLEYGDLILSGTPGGVSQVVHEDVIEASLDDLVHIKFPVVEIKNQ